MRIGFVYDLRDEYLAEGLSLEEIAEFDGADTIDSLCGAMSQLGWHPERVGRGVKLAQRLAMGERFDLVFSIAEGLHGRSREALVPAVCELFGQPYVFSDPLTMAATLDKAIAKRIVRDGGVPTADFWVIDDELNPLPAVEFPAFVKPVAEGTGKGCRASSRVTSPGELKKEVARVLRAYQQPALVETYLPGREVTVGVLGEGAHAIAIGALEIMIAPEAEGGVYGYANKQGFGDHFSYQVADSELAERAKSIAVSAYKLLGCRDVARVDLKEDASGQLRFLEVNPIPGLKPGFSDLCVLAEAVGYSHHWLMERILAGACARAGLRPPTQRVSVRL